MAKAAAVRKKIPIKDVSVKGMTLVRLGSFVGNGSGPFDKTWYCSFVSSRKDMKHPIMVSDGTHVAHVTQQEYDAYFSDPVPEEPRVVAIDSLYRKLDGTSFIMEIMELADVLKTLDTEARMAQDLDPIALRHNIIKTRLDVLFKCLNKILPDKKSLEVKDDRGDVVSIEEIPDKILLAIASGKATEADLKVLSRFLAPDEEGSDGHSTATH